MSRLLIRFLPLLLLAGCADQPAFDTIRLARGACYGECPVYEVEIDKAGHVNFNGKSWVAAKGPQQASVAPEDVALLGAALRHVHFAELRDSYHKNRDGCMTDQSDLTIEVRAGGRTKSVYWYAGCLGEDVPVRKLLWLAFTIDEIAGTGKWVAKPAP